MRNGLKYLPIFILTLITVFAGAVLSGSFASAATTGSKPVSVTVGSACNFASDVGYTVNLSIAAGSYTTTEAAVRTPATVSCTGATGTVNVQAIGYSNSTEGTTSMVGSAGSIPTGTSGAGSYWAMKVSNATATTSYTIASGFNDYHTIPDTYITIVTYAGDVSGTVSGTLRTDYKVYAAPTQTPGAFTGAVKYILTTTN